MSEFRSSAVANAAMQGRHINSVEAKLIQAEWIHWAQGELNQARQIIADLVEYAECNDPGNPHIGKAKGFLSGGEG